MESTTRDVERVAEIRAHRVQAVHLSSTSNLAQVFASPHSFGAVYLVKLLDVHPALGKVVGRRLMDTLGLPSFITISQLGSTQQNEILTACGEQHD
ncbi:MAG: hypothetical protein RI898_972 [Actinomycetota bacterium]